MSIFTVGLLLKSSWKTMRDIGQFVNWWKWWTKTLKCVWLDDEQDVNTRILDTSQKIVKLRDTGFWFFYSSIALYIDFAT